MRDFAQQIFYGLVVELFSSILAYIFKGRQHIAISIFAIGTILAGIVAFFPFPTIKWIPIAPTKTATVNPSQTSSPAPSSTSKSASDNLIFFENFDSGKTNKFRPFPNDSFYVTKDETGNFIYEINNLSTSEYLAASFGSSTWDNYAIDYRFRFLEYKGDDAQSTIYFRENYQSGLGYHLSLSPNSSVAQLAYWNNKWTEIVSKKYSFEKNIWYSVRVEAQDSEISFFINDKLVIFAIDKHLQKGEAALMAGPKTHVQFDDVRVTLFEK
jgi:hypothetical protein